MSVTETPNSRRRSGRRHPSLCSSASTDERTEAASSHGLLSSSGTSDRSLSDTHSDLSSDGMATPKRQLWVDTSMSPLSIGMAVEILVSPSGYDPDGCALSPPPPPRRKSVGWASPTSLHDTKIITPAHHPNRQGQFSTGYTAPAACPGFFEFLWGPSFECAVGETAEVALMDGDDTIGWLRCEVTVRNTDETYDITILPSRLAREHDVEHISAYAVSYKHMRKVTARA